MKTGEIRLETQPKTESPQIKQEEAETMHEVEQNKEFFKRKSEESAMNQGCLKKGTACRNKKEKKADVILFSGRKMNNAMRFLERGVVMQYVDTYSG